MNFVRYLKFLSILILLICDTAYADYAYVVRRGDTLSEIVLMFSGSLDYFPVAVRNHIANPDLIYPKDKIVLSVDRPINRPIGFTKWPAIRMNRIIPLMMKRR